MSEMLDEGTAKYFDEKFKNLGEKMDTVIRTTDENEKNIGLLETGLAVLDTSFKEHIGNHKSHDNRRRFSIEMWVIIGIFALDLIQSWVVPYFPAP